LIEKPCENCTLLENKVKYLIKTYVRSTIDKANLKVVLGSQNCVFGRSGIGYNSFNEKKVKKFANFFSKNASSDISLRTCNYCMRKGHISKSCKARKYDLPKGIMKWIPKGSRKILTMLDPTYQRVPCNVYLFCRLSKVKRKTCGTLTNLVIKVILYKAMHIEFITRD